MFFRFALDNILKELKRQTKGIEIEGRFLNHFIFADDIVIISTDASLLEEVLRELEKTSRKIELKMNLNKASHYQKYIFKYNIKIFLQYVTQVYWF